MPSSSSLSEFCAVRAAVDLRVALHCKLRMMGIEVDGPANAFTGNESMFKSAAEPELALAKWHNAIACRSTRKAAAAKIVHIAWEDGQLNIKDVLTKLLTGPELQQLISCVLS